MLPTLTIRPTKSHYTEAEAAVALGVTLEDFRRLIRRHIVDRDDDMANVPSTTYQPADLLVLKLMLKGLQLSDTPQTSEVA